MTRQEADFDAGLDFDRFGMIGFFEALTLSIAFNTSSSFNGCSEIGFERSVCFRFGIVVRPSVCEVISALSPLRLSNKKPECFFVERPYTSKAL